MQTRRLAIVATIVVATVAACHNSPSAPKATASTMLSGHFDSLAIAASAAGNFDRYRLLTYPIAFLAENGQPTTVSLNVDGTSQQYQAGVLELVGQTAGPSPVPSDSIFIEFAWTGDDVTQLVYAQILVPDTLGDVADLVGNDANAGLDSVTVATAGSTGSSGQCHAFPLPVANAAAEDLLSGSACSSGKMAAAFSLYFTPTSGFPNSAFILSSQSLPGIRLVLSASNGGQERLRALKAKPRPANRPLDVAETSRPRPRFGGVWHPGPRAARLSTTYALSMAAFLPTARLH